MRTDAQTRQALQELEELWLQAGIHIDKAEEATKYFIDECYYIYWDGEIPQDRHQICALVSALIHQANNMVDNFLEYHKIMRMIHGELKFLDAKTTEFCFL